MRWLRLLGGLAVVAAWYVLLWPIAEGAWHHFLHHRTPWPGDLARQHALLLSRIGRRQVYGPVLTWGRTQVHERGWRSEFARPLALVRPRVLRPKPRRETDLLLDRLGAEYAVPVLGLKEARALASRMAEGTGGHP